MPIHIRLDGDVTILSNIGRAFNDPRYFDAGEEVRDLLAQGFRTFIIELGRVANPGSPLLSLLMTMTRQIRKEGGEVALVGMSRAMEAFLVTMQMDEFWDVFSNVEEAKRQLLREDDAGRHKD
jgi:anti-anti-sigma regulatory factor